MNKIKYLAVYAIVAVLIAVGTSCQTAQNTNTAAKNTAADSNAVSNSASAPQLETATNSPGTPIDAYKAAYAARKNKDVPALRKLMSKDILEFFTEISGLGEKKQTTDELLMELCEKPQAATADARNEKITGDTATIEYLDETGKWQTMDFIKEDGSWKLTIPKADTNSQIDQGEKDNKPIKK